MHAAFLVSALSVAWTVASSSLAVTIGLRSATAVLVAFGAIGIVDAVGSAALVYHFHHSRRHDRLSEELEMFAHRVVLIGLFSVGCAAVVGGLVRLRVGSEGNVPGAGIALAAGSLAALIGLAMRKLQVAPTVSSNALRSDGHLSAIGALQAAVALCGMALAAAFGWHWTDAAATTLVGSGAIWLAVSTWRAENV